jgi:hypothetical protein
VTLDGYTVPSRNDGVAFNRCMMKSLWVDFLFCGMDCKTAFLFGCSFDGCEVVLSVVFYTIARCCLLLSISIAGSEVQMLTKS